MPTIANPIIGTPLTPYDTNKIKVPKRDNSGVSDTTVNDIMSVNPNVVIGLTIDESIESLRKARYGGNKKPRRTQGILE